MQKPRYQKKTPNPKFELIINEDIKARKIFLLDEEGEKLGEYHLNEALDLAKSQFKDLIQISHNPNENISIVKVIELGKYLYLQKKDSKEKKSTQKAKGMKEMSFKYNISENDLDMKMSKVVEMLSEGYSVRIFVKLRGRELNYKSKMREKFLSLEQKLINNGKSQGIKEENYGYSMILSPKAK